MVKQYFTACEPLFPGQQAHVTAALPCVLPGGMETTREVLCPLQQVGSYAVTEKYNARFWADGCRYRSQTRRNVYG